MCHAIDTKLVETRRDHRCFGCEWPFPASSMLYAHKIRGDGRIYTLYLCARCNEASEELGYDDTYQRGELKELWKPLDTPPPGG